MPSDAGKKAMPPSFFSQLLSLSRSYYSRPTFFGVLLRRFFGLLQRSLKAKHQNRLQWGRNLSILLISVPGEGRNQLSSEGFITFNLSVSRLLGFCVLQYRCSLSAQLPSTPYPHRSITPISGELCLRPTALVQEGWPLLSTRKSQKQQKHNSTTAAAVCSRTRNISSSMYYCLFSGHDVVCRGTTGKTFHIIFHGISLNPSRTSTAFHETLS